jgi:MFS transporter (putative signal transducer)
MGRSRLGVTRREPAADAIHSADRVGDAHRAGTARDGAGAIAHASRAGVASPAMVVLAVGGMYVGQSVIGGVTFTALPSVLRDQGLALEDIGLTYLAAAPWALKFLWAPPLERYRLPPGARTRSRSIVVAGTLMSAAGLCLLGLAGPASVPLLLAIVVTIAFAASTVDVACDGHAVESLSARFHGWGNAAQVGGAYLGSAIGGGLYLILLERVGWTTAAFIMAALIVVLAAPFVMSSALPSPRSRDHQPSLRHALRRADMRTGLALTAMFVAAQKWGLMMLGPFLIDAGLDLASVGLVNGAGSLAVGFGCALIGGALVRWHGARATMVLATILQVLVMAGLAAAAWSGAVPKVLLLGLALAATAALALGFVALYSRFMALSHPQQAGVDFTLLQCMDALVSVACGVAAGWVAQHVGFGSYFAVAAALAAVVAPVSFMSSAASGRAPEQNWCAQRGTTGAPLR